MHKGLTYFLLLTALTLPLSAAQPTVIGFNNLGMHCMDADYSVFSLLPPYNTVNAQVIDANGKLVTDPAGWTVTYQAVADPSGSINTTSIGKSNFWDYALPLFGSSLAPDAGLGGYSMPGTSNTPQAMGWELAWTWFSAMGIPMTPYDDAGAMNPYPMLRLTAKNAAGTVQASTDVVAPVSDDMSCIMCHMSGGDPMAQPVAGWVNDANEQRDFRLNVLRLHDERQALTPAYAQALHLAEYNASGLYASVTVDGKPILCARCHPSNALPVSVTTGVPPLTASIHSFHAHVIDDGTGMPLEQVLDRSACYTCHPGKNTKCLRDVMGTAVAADGSYAIQCQSCHGTFSVVGSPARQGWLNEPACQNCHTGTAVHNNGQIRYTNAFDADGQYRQAVDATFATTANAPAPGYALYRFSSGHGGIQCEGCHNSTHAVVPSSHANDNVQNTALQGHKGTLVECGACHPAVPSTTNGGPHGLHPLDQTWIGSHGQAAGGGRAVADCQPCHGLDYTGTVLSRTFAARSYAVQDGGTVSFWAGMQIGCYSCHNGPTSSDPSPNHAPAVADLAAATAPGTPVSIPLQASDPDGQAVTLRIVSQPASGTVGLQGATAVYFPEDGFIGADAFTYAASDGMADSNLGTVTLTVTGDPCLLSVEGRAPASAAPNQAVTFTAQASAANCPGPASYAWTFGDGSPAVPGAQAVHAYATAGTYAWQVTAASGAYSSTQGGTIFIGTMPSEDRMLFLAHTSGAAGASWRSNLSLTNMGAGPLTVAVSFTDALGTLTQGLTLSPGASSTWADAVAGLFGISGDAVGVLRVFADGVLVVSSRIWNAVPTGGTIGQSFYAMQAGEAIVQGEEAMIPDLHNGAEFRSNLGLLNLSGTAAQVRVGLFDLTGAHAGQDLIVDLPANGWIQVGDVFTQAQVPALDRAYARIAAMTADSMIWAYGSVVDNQTNDPTSLPMVKITR